VAAATTDGRRMGVCTVIRPVAPAGAQPRIVPACSTPRSSSKLVGGYRTDANIPYNRFKEKTMSQTPIASINKIAEDTYRISIALPDIIPGGFSFNQYLGAFDEREIKVR
jgi:hypothetical protein